ncbi:PAS domain-containing protein [Niveibacterium sp. 24ML]|uniref:chemotaxis protein CheB n=1 Tax=Niveibacterium sp. 24ML TaxID=2985512 RepID=UPI00226EFAFD|nr:chemotaxis protein CheB [Niveibacterium sp. 24ML]MCX9158502.1 PAS domain-containing protein [Niveibacterium sp. 24ML]
MSQNQPRRSSNGAATPAPCELTLRDESTPASKGRTAVFPVIGIGASAGGLEAFEKLFRHLPATSSMAFIIVTHLDPSHESILTEILQRATSMPIVEAHNQLAVEPGHVYVIPPNRDMAILNRSLQLSIPDRPRGQRMPIDGFLRSLAEDQGEHAIGIILSGTGSDGTLGLRAIIGAGGFSLVQAPQTAKYDGMPNSAIRAGYATHVLPPEDMPAALFAGLRHISMQDSNTFGVNNPNTNALNQILMLLRSATGHDFSQYKKSNIGRRVERRMSQHDIGDIQIYARYVREHPAELHALFKELLINVTSFFREPEAFALLRNEVLPKLLAERPAEHVLRIWVAACATGEEAYSLAMQLREYMDETQSEFRTQIYSTDLDDDAIATARAGVYAPNIAQDLTPERLNHFFVKEDAGYRVKKHIREMVVFATQNVIKDPPFTHLDLLSCRNLMIYMEPELQHRLVASFHYALNPGGVLFLSPSESVGRHVELFSAISTKWKIYRAIGSRSVLVDRAQDTPDGTTSGTRNTAMPREPNFAELTRRTLLRFYAPASVVTDLKGNIAYVYGDTGAFLRPAPGHATLNIIKMAHQGLQHALRSAMQTALQGTPTINRDVVLKEDGTHRTISFSLRPISDRDFPEGLLLISFHDVPSTPKPSRSKRTSAPSDKSTEVQRIEELERELAYTKENLQATVEEQQSANEELQSTNEELETSKEELQSVNEEIVTVNAELQAKIDQLARMQNDMKNLLDNISTGAIFLDEHLWIRRFTREATQVFRLVASDVGRPLADINSSIDGVELITLSRQVLETLAPYEAELRCVDGRWYQVRIQPYRTLDNVIDGVVLTFTDITKRVLAERAAELQRQLASGIFNTVREPLVVLDADLSVISASRSFYQAFHVTETETVHRPIYELGNGQWNISALRDLLGSVLEQGQTFENHLVEHDYPVIGPRTMRVNARRVQNEGQQAPQILLAIEDA